jgi:anti-sigma regulatory factor (Ser/Thr protein kinase)
MASPSNRSAPVHVLHGSSGALASAARSIAGCELIPQPAASFPCDGIVVIELDQLPEEIWQSVRRQRPDGRGVIVVGGPALRPRLAQLFEDRALRHLLLTSDDLEADDLLPTIDRLRGVIAADAPLDPTSERITLQQASEKAAAIDRASRFARAAGASTRHAGSFCTVVEELITNAVYNAPVDADGHARFARLGRDVEVQLDSSESVEIDLSFKDERLQVRVTDCFGSLTVDRVQESMARCLRKGTDQLARQPGGAGIGLYYSWELLSRLQVEIHPKKRTRVVGTIDTRGSHRAFARRAKSFDVFLEGELLP